jgi:hypothetical protein
MKFERHPCTIGDSLKAIRYFGSQRALAKMVGVKQQMISYWLNHESGISFKNLDSVLCQGK